MDNVCQIKPAIIAVLLANKNQGIQNAMPIGTGFFVSSDGYILTCYHVVEPLIASGAPILVKTVRGVFEADCIADKSRTEDYLDWAVLKVKANVKAGEMEKGTDMFPCLRLLAECRNGDEWCTIGYELAERADGIPNMGTIIGPIDRTEADCQDIDLNSLNPIRDGVSGAPLFNKRTGSVAGVIKEVFKGTRTQAFATSIESVLKFWQGLESLNANSATLIISHPTIPSTEVFNTYVSESGFKIDCPRSWKKIDEPKIRFQPVDEDKYSPSVYMEMDAEAKDGKTFNLEEHIDYRIRVRKRRGRCFKFLNYEFENNVRCGYAWAELKGQSQLIFKEFYKINNDSLITIRFIGRSDKFQQMSAILNHSIKSFSFKE